jgi:Zn-dependent protease|tara:strand:- start:710 stop:1834 length:1125 start_codon:yes stop_codon:yes gene_type:complete
MIGASITLIEVFGIKIRVNISWAFIAILLAWGLAEGYFPTINEKLPEATYWWMSIVAVLGLFASILLHELAHSLVARAYGMEITGITLWLLGGIAELKGEPPSPKVELLMAIAGPAMSVFLGTFFWLSAGVLQGFVSVATVLSYLGMLNLILAAFNMVPAFPLDGGRVARAIIWMHTGDYLAATKTAARMGSLFGLGLIAFGFLGLVTGAGLASLWWVVLGMFVRFAADSSNLQAQTKNVLAQKTVREFMTPKPITVSAETSVADLVENYIYHYDFEFFPVMDGGRVAGSVSLQEVRTLPLDRHKQVRVREIMKPISANTLVSPRDLAANVMTRMQETGASLLMVMDRDDLVGVIATKDLLRIIAIQSALEQPE